MAWYPHLRASLTDGERPQDHQCAPPRRKPEGQLAGFWMSADGKRQSKNFPRKGDADAWLKEIAAGRKAGRPL
jgi:hypothetical protein